MFMHEPIAVDTVKGMQGARPPIWEKLPSVGVAADRDNNPSAEVTGLSWNRRYLFRKGNIAPVSASID
jgi:hypothetical protein